MATAEDDLLVAMELHSVEGIRSALTAGVDARAPLRGKSITAWLTEMYTRSDRFTACLRELLAHGARLEDPAIAPVLLDDTAALKIAIERDPGFLRHRTTMVSAFTPLDDATLLHVAAEFGHVNVARVLIDQGADVNARAAVDAFGMNGQTALFHTVNSIANHSAPVMELLLGAGAVCDIRLSGITWGRGFEWESTFFDVTPVSYAQLGLLPQVHRKELDVYANVARLLEVQGRSMPPLPNVPNRYLRR